MKLAVPALVLALIRNGLAMGQDYHRACRENRKPDRTPRSSVTPRSSEVKSAAHRRQVFLAIGPVMLPHMMGHSNAS